MNSEPESKPPVVYTAGGGVVVRGDDVLVVDRPSRSQLRLPKGHVEAGETPEQAAVREVYEETGYDGLEVVADLGVQVVEFDAGDRWWVRTERYFLMACSSDTVAAGVGEEEFNPVWMSWERAISELTFEAEREWVRRARLAVRPSA